MAEEPLWLNTGFVAKSCGVSGTTVLRWIKKGQLSAFRLPSGHYRILNDDFINFLTRNNLPLPAGNTSQATAGQPES